MATKKVAIKDTEVLGVTIGISEDDTILISISPSPIAPRTSLQKARSLVQEAGESPEKEKALKLLDQAIQESD